VRTPKVDGLTLIARADRLALLGLILIRPHHSGETRRYFAQKLTNLYQRPRMSISE